MAHAPDHFRRYNDVYGQLRFDNHLGVRVTELVRIAVSQTTQCQVCMAGRYGPAVAEGVTEEVVCQINDAHRPDMTPAESAAVNFALKFANDHQSITDTDKAALREPLHARADRRASTALRHVPGRAILQYRGAARRRSVTNTLVIGASGVDRPSLPFGRSSGARVESGR